MASDCFQNLFYLKTSLPAQALSTRQRWGDGTVPQTCWTSAMGFDQGRVGIRYVSTYLAIGTKLTQQITIGAK